MLMGTLNYMAPEQMIGVGRYRRARRHVLGGRRVLRAPDLPAGISGRSRQRHHAQDHRRQPRTAGKGGPGPRPGRRSRSSTGASRNRATTAIPTWRRSAAISPCCGVATTRPARRTSRSNRAAGTWIDCGRRRFESHLEEARQALDSGDFTAALEASQRALLLNGDDREALECEQRARTGLEEHQINEWLTSARTQINLGALTSASLLVDRALSLNSSSPEAAAVRALVDEARQRLAEAGSAPGRSKPPWPAARAACRPATSTRRSPASTKRPPSIRRTPRPRRSAAS